MKKIQMMLLACMVMALAALPAAAREKVYRAKLSGDQGVPKVNTPARGELKITYTGKEMTFRLSLSRITSPTAAHIHRGRKGENGTPVAGLFGGPPKLGSFDGVLAQGAISNESLMGDLEGRSIADLARLIESGEAYVDVLTVTYPLGEISGRIK